MIGDCSATLYITFYLRFISHSIQPIIWVGFALNVLSLVTAFWLIESPLWLISVGENERAKKNIKFIARFNGIKDLQVTNILPNEDQNDDEPAESTYAPVDEEEIIEDKNAAYSTTSTK